MNDRLKYRIFYDNKIVYPNSWNDIESIYECLKQQIMWDCKIDTDIKFDHITNNLIFMQCTGLKDKNGKLIYEKDFVKNFDNRIYQVFWIDDAACFMVANIKTKTIQRIHSLISLKNDLEVIGNIYENKDLLNENS